MGIPSERGDQNTQAAESSYKCRVFSNRVLDMLVANELYYANPNDFNDPLDSRPSLGADLDANALEHLLGRLVEQRTNAEMDCDGKGRPRTIKHITRLSRSRVGQLLHDVRYNAGNPLYEVDDPYRFLLKQNPERNSSVAMIRYRVVWSARNLPADVEPLWGPSRRLRRLLCSSGCGKRSS